MGVMMSLREFIEYSRERKIAYRAWTEKAKKSFLSQHPELKENDIFVCEDGTVCIIGSDETFVDSVVPWIESRYYMEPEPVIQAN